MAIIDEHNLCSSITACSTNLHSGVGRYKLFDMIYNPLIGTWTLLEFANYSSSGAKVPWPHFMTGRLIYASPDIVSVAINRQQVCTDGRVVEYNSFYCGRFVLMNENTIEHIVEQSSVQSRIGEFYQRAFLLTENRLELHGNGLTGQVSLVWARE